GVEKAAEETKLIIDEALVKKDEESTGTEPAENVEALRLQEETQGIIEALADRHRQEEESMVEYYARINEAIRIGEDAGTITKQQAANARKKLKEDEQRFEIDTVVSTMGAIVSALSTGGKKSQEIAKKIAIAKAIVSGGQAAVDAWKAGMSTGGPYAPIVAAAYTAASLAKTGAMISSIKGGSKPSAGGGLLPSV
ncbi:MAG: hypothetical protein GY814_08935, partial [Gammaproteobacteria bacterium]|nr:hypothetical protein [Gammaproteobacteria bacterium]